MAKIDWMIKGPWLTTCNCVVGCPCQFNALPSLGACRAATGCEIEEGHFGKVRLDGVRFAGMFAWPGAIHFGGGEAQSIIDERATRQQRDAILTILKGEETEPGATIFNVFAGTFAKVHDPLFLPIEFSADVDQRLGKLHVAGVLDVTSEPIRNPVTGAPHRVRLDMPSGFEYTQAEVAQATTRTGKNAAIALGWRGSHAHFTQIHFTRQGVVR
ncbi:MAG TPA: DUF1326 domain-containing protein [Gammaproteobacteria bacterium]|jgi:hypothetical protein|nr:DUF1326 domain-containing protein [Gammaproteobacteria bacterium]